MQITVTVCGDSLSGKTLMISHIVSRGPGISSVSSMGHYAPTVGLDFAFMDVSPSRRILLWDLGGQAEYLKPLSYFFTRCDIVLVVNPVCSPVRLKYWKEVAKQHTLARIVYVGTYYGECQEDLLNCTEYDFLINNRDMIGIEQLRTYLVEQCHKILLYKNATGQINKSSYKSLNS